MKRLLFNLKALGLALMACIVTTNSLATTVTYTATSTKAVKVSSGTAPEGSSATLVHTYGTTCQLTGGNSDKLTLSGYDGMKITGITLNMKSNKSAGAGTFSAVAGTTTIAAISKATTFDKWYDNDAYTTAYKDVKVTMTNNAYTIGTGESVVLSVAATANSLYIQSYTITYESVSGQPAKTISSITASGTPETFWIGDTFNHNGITITATYSDNSTANVTSNATFTKPDMTTAGDKTVTVSYGGKQTSYTATVKTIANTLESAYTTAEAIKLYDAGKDLTTEVYVKGTVSKVEKLNDDGSITYWLDNNTFEIFKGFGINKAKFTAVTDISANAEVVVKGKLYKYGSTYEIKDGSSLAKYDGEVAPEPTKEAPKFTSCTGNKSYSKNNTASNIVVTVSGNPTPTLQWYVNTTNSNEGGKAISGQTKESYKPSTSEAGTKYYYCVATNSEGTATSNVVAITVKDAGTIEFSNAITCLVAGQTNDVTVTSSSYGNNDLSVKSNDTKVATAEIKNGVVTVKAVGTGSTSIVVMAAENDKYAKTQKSFSVDIITPAALPISFNGGVADLKPANGLFGYSLGKDYSSSPKLKFEDTGDYVLISFNEAPNELSYSIKGNSFSKSTFEVQESADNAKYTTIKSYTSLGSTKSEKYALNSTTRFVRFIYTNKSGGNVALGNINISKAPAVVTTANETAAAGAAAWTTTTYNRTIATGKYSTICLPYKATAEGAAIYKMAGKNMNGANVASLTFELTEETAEASNTLEAGVPYLFRATADAQTFTKVGTDASNVAPIAGVTGFTGTYAEFELPIGDYFLYNNGDVQEFRPAGNYGDGRTYVVIGAFKCYISSLDNIQETPATTPLNARRRVTIGGITDEATGIFTLETENVKPNNGKYMENGNIVIIRNGIKYNTKGQIIK